MCQSCTVSARVTDNPNALVHLVHVQETGTATARCQRLPGKLGFDFGHGEKIQNHKLSEISNC